MVAMPRVIDADHRRRTVTEAAWRVLVRDGLTELSVRKVAAEAGLPPSSLRYTFPTQASVREAAVDLLLERLSQRAAAAALEGSPVERARAMLHELLPLDRERRIEMEVSLALGAMAMTDVALQRSHQRALQAVREVCGRALQIVGASSRELPMMHALVDGLALHLVQQSPQNDPAWAVDVLDAQVDRVSAAAA
jgi:AcrR family transcriptional regulator